MADEHRAGDDAPRFEWGLAVIAVAYVLTLGWVLWMIR